MHIRRLLVAVAGLAALAGQNAVLAADTANQPNIITVAVPAIPGPKRTIAVGQIDALGPFATNAGSSVGGAVAAMLTTALSQSGRFTVVERDALNQIVGEQELAANRVSAGNLAPKPGSVIPAQYLVVGAVTEYSTNDSGTNGNGGNSGGSFGLGLSFGHSKGRVAFDLRLIDTLTGSVVRTFSVRQKLTSSNVGLSGGTSGITLGTGKFWNTPLGDATRRALNDAVVQIAQAVSTGHWQGQVVELDGGTLYINAGSEAGVRSGDRFVIQRAGKVFTDPATGRVLSSHLVDLGTVTIDRVEANLASGPLAVSGGGTPARGDLVVSAN